MHGRRGSIGFALEPCGFGDAFNGVGNPAIGSLTLTGLVSDPAIVLAPNKMDQQHRPLDCGHGSTGDLPMALSQ